MLEQGSSSQGLPHSLLVTTNVAGTAPTLASLPPSASAVGLTGISCPTSRRCYAVGNNVMLTSDDGGRTWSSGPDPRRSTTGVDHLVLLGEHLLRRRPRTGRGRRDPGPRLCHLRRWAQLARRRINRQRPLSTRSSSVRPIPFAWDGPTTRVPRSSSRRPMAGVLGHLAPPGYHRRHLCADLRVVRRGSSLRRGRQSSGRTPSQTVGTPIVLTTPDAGAHWSAHPLGPSTGTTREGRGRLQHPVRVCVPCSSAKVALRPRPPVMDGPRPSPTRSARTSRDWTSTVSYRWRARRPTDASAPWAPRRASRAPS